MRILLCDDHRLFTDALASVLASHDWEVVDRASDPAHAVAVVTRERIDVCLMDLNFPDGDTGVAGIASVRESSPDTKIIVLTATSDPGLVMRSVQAGADVIAFKDDEIEDIIAAVASTQSVTDEPEVRAPDPRPPPAPLTAWDTDSLARFLTHREVEVLEHLIMGESSKQIAARLGISYSTARTHIQNILAKLCVHSRLEAVAFAVEHGLSRH